MDQAAADLNNAAVAYLERGDLRTALDLFRSALRTTLGEVHPGAPPAVPLPRPPSSANSGSRRCGDLTTPSQQMELEKLNSDATPFIHSQGFGIVGSPGAYSPHPLVNTTVVSTIVIFNLAVVFHQKGLHEKSLSDTRLIKAHSLYFKAHLLLHDAGVYDGATGNAVVDLLSMAVSNNLAHVCYELSSYEESRAHFDALIRFALTVIPGRYGDRYVGSVMDQQKSNFLLNAIILHEPILAPAA